MNRVLLPLLASLLAVAATGTTGMCAGGAPTAPLAAVKSLVDSLEWLGQSAFRLSGPATGGVTIYFDPVGSKVREADKADIVLVSHSHGDHFSPSDILKVTKPGTVVVGPKDCRTGSDFRAVAPGDALTLGAITIEAVPAYNIGKAYHPKASQWVGYIVTISGVRLYFAGDTDRIPEMKDLRVDVALLPIGGTYTMTVPEAVEAAQDIKAAVTIPMHYGAVVGKKKDGETFKALLDGKLYAVVKTVQ